MKKTLKCFICMLAGIFMISVVSVSGFAANSSDEDIDDDFFGDEFDEDDDLFDVDDWEEEVEPPVKKEVKKDIKKKEKKKAKKEPKKETVTKKEKTTREKDVDEFDLDEDLFDLKDEGKAEAIEEKKVVKREVEITFSVYKAKKGDTLITVAEKYYSDPDRWEEIWKYNKYIKDPMVLFIEDEIIVPIYEVKIKDELESEELQQVKEKFEKSYEKQSFYAGEIEYDGSILEIKNEDLLMPVAGNIVYVDIGLYDGVKKDSLYTVYREEGEIARKIGLVRITGDIGENDATALIVSSFEPIFIDDFILEKK